MCIRIHSSLYSVLAAQRLKTYRQLGNVLGDTCRPMYHLIFLTAIFIPIKKVTCSIFNKSQKFSHTCRLSKLLTLYWLLLPWDVIIGLWINNTSKDILTYFSPHIILCIGCSFLTYCHTACSFESTTYGHPAGKQNVLNAIYRNKQI